jgi:hypothetical protein
MHTTEIGKVGLHSFMLKVERAALAYLLWGSGRLSLDTPLKKFNEQNARNPQAHCEKRCSGYDSTIGADVHAEVAEWRMHATEISIVGLHSFMLKVDSRLQRWLTWGPSVFLVRLHSVMVKDGFRTQLYRGLTSLTYRCRGADVPSGIAEWRMHTTKIGMVGLHSFMLKVGRAAVAILQKLGSSQGSLWVLIYPPIPRSPGGVCMRL